MAAAKLKNKIFPVSTFVKDLPSSLVPKPLSSISSDSAPSAPKRLIIVGDVHGMKDAVLKLLNEVKFDRQNGDHLVLVGDIINKGTDNQGMIDLAVELGASAIRGNHDNSVLDAAAETRFRNGEWVEAQASINDKGPCAPDEKPSPDENTPSEVAPIPQFKPHSEVTNNTAASLSTTQLKWLAELPLILRINIPVLDSSPIASLIVVHGGLVPGLALEQQDAHAVMHMRSLQSSESGVLQPTEEEGEEGWAAVWERNQEELPEPERSMVVFGHDAKRRLQIRKYSVGLDTGCVYGNKLSALVVTATEDEIVHQIVQVECSKPEEEAAQNQ